MRTWRGRRPRLPPEPWLDQHRGAVARGDVPGRQLAAVVGGDADLLVRDPERRLADLPARRVGEQVGGAEAHRDQDERDGRAGEPAEAVQGAPAEGLPPRRAARGGDGGEAGRDEQEPAEDVADAGDVAPVGAGVDDVQAVRGDPEADGEQPDHDADARSGWDASVAAGPRRRRSAGRGSRARRGSTCPARRRRGRAGGRSRARARPTAAGVRGGRSARGGRGSRSCRQRAVGSAARRPWSPACVGGPGPPSPCGIPNVD